MRVTREQAAENRERIVEVAARLLRERGFDGIGVADLMKSAGLTHGGFYGHFSSKDDLAAEAVARALDKSVQRRAAAPRRRRRIPSAPLPGPISNPPTSTSPARVVSFRPWARMWPGRIDRCGAR